MYQVFEDCLYQLRCRDDFNKYERSMDDMTNLRRDIKKGNTLIFEIKYKKRKQNVWEDKERYYSRVSERKK